jgi:similar to stage IV sporulation protein
LPELAWVGIRIQGSVATVEVVEKVLVEKDATKIDLVAAKPGLVSSVIVLSGEAAVSEGDTVLKGDCLIRGIEHDGEYIQAKGIVQARVWYEATNTIALQNTIQSYTGRQKSMYFLKTGETERRIFPFHMPFDNCVVSEQAVLSKLNIGRVSVELVKRTCMETSVVPQSLTVDEAIRIAMINALTAVLKALPDKAEILQRTVESFESDIDGRQSVQVRVVVETLEDIGTYDMGGENSS